MNHTGTYYEVARLALGRSLKRALCEAKRLIRKRVMVYDGGGLASLHHIHTYLPHNTYMRMYMDIGLHFTHLTTYMYIYSYKYLNNP